MGSRGRPPLDRAVPAHAGSRVATTPFLCRGFLGDVAGAEMEACRASIAYEFQTESFSLRSSANANAAEQNDAGKLASVIKQIGKFFGLSNPLH